MSRSDYRGVAYTQTLSGWFEFYSEYDGRFIKTDDYDTMCSLIDQELEKLNQEEDYPHYIN